MEDLILTSAQVCEQLGLTDSKLRTLKSRKKDQLIEGVHWMSDGGRTLWTNEGVTMLRQLCNSSATECNATVAACNSSEFVEELAWGVIEENLPRWVQQSVQRILYSPTQSDRQRLKSILEKLAPRINQITHRAALESGVSAQLLEASND